MYEIRSTAIMCLGIPWRYQDPVLLYLNLTKDGTPAEQFRAFVDKLNGVAGYSIETDILE